MTPIVDMHCHLDLYSNPASEVQKIAESKAYVLSVTTTPKAWHGTRRLAQGHARIQTALGLHPQLAKERKSELPLFDRLLPDARYVGEVGLDGGSDCASFWQDQVEVFDHILSKCSSAGGRILSIHSRAAATPVLDALDKHQGYGVAILHWFSGTQSELSRAMDLGCWFSVGAAMLRSKKGRSLAADMPPNRVLTETDGPFGTILKKPLEPGQCAEAIAILASLWKLDDASTQRNIVASFRELVST